MLDHKKRIAKKKKATVLGLLGNIFLFVIKIIIGLMSNSLALISDAFNSFSDIASSTLVLFSVNVSSKKADSTHPFGHHRAEPIAALITSVIMGILGFELIKTAVQRIVYGYEAEFGLIPIAVLLLTIIVKIIMFIYLHRVGKEEKSPAILATSYDCRNDVFISGAAIVGILGAMFGFRFLDPFVGLVISLLIIKTGFEIAIENIDYLMGRTAPRKLIKKIKKIAMDIPGVYSVHDVKAHYVGIFYHVQIHICVNKRLSTDKSHAIGKKVEKSVYQLEEIDKVFVHIDPS